MLADANIAAAAAMGCAFGLQRLPQIVQLLYECLADTGGLPVPLEESVWGSEGSLFPVLNDPRFYASTTSTTEPYTWAVKTIGGHTPGGPGGGGPVAVRQPSQPDPDWTNLVGMADPVRPDGLIRLSNDRWMVIREAVRPFKPGWTLGSFRVSPSFMMHNWPPDRYAHYEGFPLVCADGGSLLILTYTYYGANLYQWYPVLVDMETGDSRRWDQPLPSPGWARYISWAWDRSSTGPANACAAGGGSEPCVIVAFAETSDPMAYESSRVTFLRLRLDIDAARSSTEIPVPALETAGCRPCFMVSVPGTHNLVVSMQVFKNEGGRQLELVNLTEGTRAKLLENADGLLLHRAFCLDDDGRRIITRAVLPGSSECLLCAVSLPPAIFGPPACDADCACANARK